MRSLPTIALVLICVLGVLAIGLITMHDRALFTDKPVPVVAKKL